MDDAATEKKLGEVEEGKEGPDVGEDRDEVTIENFLFGTALWTCIISGQKVK